MRAGQEVADVLGNVRPVVHAWPDGSWECPHCGYGCHPRPARPPGLTAGPAEEREACRNPACLANPDYPPARARADVAARERREAEEAARRRDAEWAARRRREEQEAVAIRLAAVRAEAEARGACVRCALKEAPRVVKMVRHRGPCPLARR